MTKVKHDNWPQTGRSTLRSTCYGGRAHKAVAGRPVVAEAMARQADTDISVPQSRIGV